MRNWLVVIRVKPNISRSALIANNAPRRAGTMMTLTHSQGLCRDKMRMMDALYERFTKIRAKLQAINARNAKEPNMWKCVSILPPER